jgi:hypothetical protein
MGLLGLEAVYPKPRLSPPGQGHRFYPYLLNSVAKSDSLIANLIEGEIWS